MSTSPLPAPTLLQPLADEKNLLLDQGSACCGGSSCCTTD